MIIMGFDPGLAILGYGIVKKDGYNLNHIAHGVIETVSGMPLDRRLHILFDELQSLIDKYRPDSIAVEEMFFSKNVKTAISVAHARGIIILSASLKSIPLYEYTPLEVKQALTGYGRAQKLQMQQMVKILLGLELIPKPDDAADALAVSICHINRSPMLSKIEGCKNF